MSRSLFALLWVPAGRADRSQPEALPILGKSFLAVLLDSVSRLKPVQTVLIAPSGARKLEPDSISAGLKVVSHKPGAGIAYALKSALPFFQSRKKSRVDVLLVDTRFPLLTSRTLKSLRHRHHGQNCDFLALAASTGTPALAADLDALAEVASQATKLKSVGADLPSLIRAAGRSGKKTGYFALPDPEEAVFLTSSAAFRQAVGVLRDREMRRLESRGVILLDPASTWISPDVRIGRGTVIYPSVIIEGCSRIGRDCLIQSFVRMVDTRVGDRVRILGSTVIEKSVIEDDAQIGPFARFRPGTKIQDGARVGNFVEMKNTIFGRGSKAGHLSYLGDALIGEKVNIGAGTITCNYDGLRKSRTIIEDRAFIGSGTELVAPVKVGRGAYIGAGSTITKDVSPEALAVSRSGQIEKPGWAKRKLKK